MPLLRFNNFQPHQPTGEVRMNQARKIADAPAPGRVEMPEKEKVKEMKKSCMEDTEIGDDDESARGEVID